MLDELVGLRPFGGVNDFVVGRLGSAVSNVFPNRRRKEQCVLKNDADLGAQRFLFDLPDIAAVERDRAGRRIVKARDQTQQRTFAGASASDYSDHLIRFDPKVDSVQHLSILRVAEPYVVKSDGAFGRFDCDCIRRIDHVVFSIEHFEATFRAGGCALHRPRGISDRFQRLIKHQQVSAENEQCSERQRAGENVQRSDVIHRRRPENHQRADYQRAVHVCERETQVRLQTLPGLLMKLHHFELFATKRVYHAYGAEPFLRLRQHGAFLFLNECRFAANAVREKINRHDDERHDA